MNPWETIYSLKLGEPANKLLKTIIKTDNVDTNLYLGMVEIIPDGEPNLDQLAWIPRKIENFQNLTEKLLQTANSFSTISEFAKKSEVQAPKAFYIKSLKNQFYDNSFNITKQIDGLKTVLKDMENAINSISYPQNYLIKTLYKINPRSSEVIIDENQRIAYGGKIIRFTAKYMKCPMHFIIYSLSDDCDMAFVSYGYHIAPKTGAIYHQVWENINENPMMISSECVWRS